MYVYANGFVFDGKSSDDFELMVCEIDNNKPSNSPSGQIEFLTTDSPIGNRWYKTGNTNYKEPLQFTFQVIKNSHESFDAYEYSAISRWLVRKDSFKDFMIVKGDYDNIHFNAQLNVEPVEVGKEIIGITITGTTDSSFGYNQSITKTIDVQGYNTLSIVDMSDEIGYIYPDIEINVKNDCDVTITNMAENRQFYIKQCIANEVIKIDGKFLQMTTTALSHNLYEYTNYMFPRIVNDYNKRKNDFLIEGNCTLTMRYRPIRKVGV